MLTETIQTTDVHSRYIRYPLFLFLFVAIFSFAVTEKMLLVWERRQASGVHSFSGIVIDAGVGMPANRERGRWQIVRLSNGVPVMLWMNDAARLGDRVTGIASFKCGEGMRNPGGYSTRLMSRSNGVAHAGYLVRCDIERVDHIMWTIRRLPDLLRDRVRFHVPSFWESTESGALLASFTLGDTGLLSDIERYHLRVSGLSHLTSVSGTHLYFFLVPFQNLARRMKRTRRGKQRMLFVLTLVPGMLCGWKSGIARASLSVFLLRLDTVFGRRRDPINLLLFVATCLLALNPFAIRCQSFWMSLAAAGSIRFVSTSVNGRRSRIAEYPADGKKQTEKNLRVKSRTGCFLNRAVYSLKRIFLISLTAQVAVLPYTLMTSAGFQLLSPLTNTLAMPLASCLTAFAYVSVVVLSLIPVDSCRLMRAGTFLASLINPLAGLFHKLARWAATVRLTFMPIEWLVMILFVALLGYVIFQLNTRSAIIKRFAVIIVTIGLAVSILWITRERKDWRVIFLDVDQGDATLIISPEGYTCLIDGGDRGHGFYTILPVVRLFSLRRIDIAIVTHAHGDHATGIAELLECRMIERLCMPVVSHRESRSSGEEDWEVDLTETLLMLADEGGVYCVALKAGDRLELGSLLIDVFYPEEERDNRDLNDDSLVLRCEIGGFKILFTGDVTETGERQLLSRSIDLSADVLHVPHHGSKSSSSMAFLESVSPRMSVISVGRDNRFSHPHACVLQRLRDIGSDVFRTDRSGALILNIREGKGTMTEWITPCIREEE